MARFERGARLLKPAEFKAVFESGKRLHQSWYIAVVHPQLQSTSVPGEIRREARLGLAIAKKRVALATQRNRLKREIRESFRLQRHQLPQVDIVIMVRTEIRSTTAAQRLQQLDALWLRVRKLAAPSSVAR